MSPIRNVGPDRLVVLGGGAQPCTKVAGRVTLVGAGPGDPDLLTVKAARAIARADVVVHDRLVSPEILGLAPADARLFYVGKKRSDHAVPQGEVNALLVALAREGLDVVRLKGGDPFVFGRGGEELLACREAGVACEVIPGISAAQAAAAAAGAPLTHRGMAQAVTFVTGHASEGEGAPGETWAEPQLDWAALARPNQTVAVYMGLAAAGRIACRLVAAGRDPQTPVLVVENASRPGEQRLLTTLDELDLSLAAADIAGPAVLLIGETAALAEVEPQQHLSSRAAQPTRDPGVRVATAALGPGSPRGGVRDDRAKKTGTI